VAAAYRAEGRAIGAGEPIRYVTASLEVTYLRPTPVGPLTLRARPGEVLGRKMTVTCSVYAATGEECARGTVVAARVPAAWRTGA
jgi:acyl-coenzyme A thioesterase PaaI-like protein